MRRLLLGLLIALFCQVTSAAAEAKGDQKPTTAQQRREAKRLWNQAFLAYEHGEYEEAIVKWKRSYELSGEPLIFENIANAYERLGDTKRTHEYLRKWRKHAPADEQEALARRIKNLEERIEHMKEAAPPDAAQPGASEREPPERQTERPGDRPPDEPDVQDEAEREREQELLRNQVIAWTVTGVGAAAVIAGVVMDVVAASSRPDEDSACGAAGDELLCRASMREDIEASNELAIAGDITWIAGSVVAATGVVLLLTIAYGESSAEDAAGQARLVPLIGPTAGGLSLTGRF